MPSLSFVLLAKYQFINMKSLGLFFFHYWMDLKWTLYETDILLKQFEIYSLKSTQKLHNKKLLFAVFLYQELRHK